MVRKFNFLIAILPCLIFQRPKTAILVSSLLFLRVLLASRSLGGQMILHTKDCSGEFSFTGRWFAYVNMQVSFDNFQSFVYENLLIIMKCSCSSVQIFN